MSLEFIKHDRPVSAHDLQKYGKNATHDIKVPILLAYELGQIPDKNGTLVTVDQSFMKKVMDATNKHIKVRHSSLFARLKSWLNKPVEESETIPLIKDHKTDNVDGVVGYSKGLVYADTIDGVYAIFIQGLIQDNEAKTKVENKLLRATSFGTRADGSIKEISFVINPAIPHGGPIFSEEENNDKKPEEKKSLELSEKQIQLQEEISELEFQETELSETIIPNHIILSKLIKTGRLQPWKYKELVMTKNTTALELMESASVGVDMGMMLGTFKPPMDIDNSGLLIKNIVNKYQERTGKKESKDKKDDKKSTPVLDPMINHGVSFEEIRKKELKDILELAEHGNDIVKKYIRVELGEKVEAPEYNDKYLNEYLNEVKKLRDKIKTLKIQLGEFDA